jgi:pyruvate kinase
MPNTKIVATLGPACQTPDVIKAMIQAGVNVFRLNASHGNHESHAASIRAVRDISAECGGDTGILLDLQGPKIRLGKIENGGCTLATGANFTITVQPLLGNCQRASTGYANFGRDVHAGDRVLLADGAVELRAIKSDGESVRFEVVAGGPIGDNKGINLPGVAISSDSLTEKDIEDVAFGIEQGVDMIALSFVRTADDVRKLRNLLVEKHGADRMPVVAKIEKPQGWENIGPILEESNGVMVARGDLGVEMAVEKVPFIQKAIIRRARQRARFVITATQMLESMIAHPSPTRAEVSDVANAIYDGTDAVMLSGETSIGKFPVEAVKVMARIAAETERTGSIRPNELPWTVASSSHAEIIAQAATHAAMDASVLAVVVFTASGSSARLISRYHPPDRIYAITPSPAVARQLSINYGVTALHAEDVGSTDEMLALTDRLLLENGILKRGDAVVFVAGQPVGRPGTTNMMKLHRIGESR